MAYLHCVSVTRIAVPHIRVGLSPIQNVNPFKITQPKSTIINNSIRVRSLTVTPPPQKSIFFPTKSTTNFSGRRNHWQWQWQSMNIKHINLLFGNRNFVSSATIAATARNRRSGSFFRFLLLLLLMFGGFTYFIRPEGGSQAVELYDPGKPTIFTSMFDAKTLFHSKTTSELYFSLLIFKLCSLDWVINLAPKLISWAESAGLEHALYWFVKKTFYKQFCAGETLEEAKRSIQKLHKEGMERSTEEAINATAWDSNMNNVLKLLAQAQEHLTPVKFVPLKVTSLMPPHLLERLTELLRYQAEHPTEGATLNREWNAKPSLAPIKSFPPGYDPNKAPSPLSPEELKLLGDALTRLSTICEAAQKAKIRLLIDAEQTFRQPAIDYLALYLSRKFNKTEPLVFNTYQMYLKNTKNVLQDHLATSLREDFFLACKVVRGAYLITETERANKFGYESLIYPTKMNTDDAYDKAISTILEKMPKQKVALVVATHNVESVMLACQKARETKIPSNHPNLYFGQLKGMSDQLTYGLSYTKFNACPVSNVIPYLVRRLQENRDIMGGTQVERQLMWSELKRRNFGLTK